jgi:subtilisin family serine protease
LRLAVAFLGVLAISSCTALPPGAGGGNHDDASLNISADRLIVVTVDNRTRPLIGEPGSTPHGYSATNSYTASDEARAVTAALAHDYGLQEVREWPILPLKVHCLVFALPPSADREALLRRLSADDRVKLAQPLQLFSALSDGNVGTAPVAPAGLRASPLSGSPYNDPYYGLQHGFNEIDAAAAQQWSRGDGVSVAIIDTGVATLHPDLEGRVAVTRNFIDEDMKSFQTDRHGTEVAGIIAADANNGLGIVGIAPGVRLQIYKACEPAHPQSMEAVCNSFTLARALGAALDAHVQIVNLSLGGPADPLLTQLVSYGVQHGMIFVGAMPYSGKLDGFPLDVAGVIAVDEIGRSEHTPGVLHAPGRDIVSTAPGGSYDFVTGSSFAAAHVTGAIALLRARVSGLSATSLASVFERTRVQSELGESINVCAALDAVQPRDNCMHSARAVATATAAH